MSSSVSTTTSLSAHGPKPTAVKPHVVEEYNNVVHSPHADILPSIGATVCKVEPLSIQVEDTNDGFVPGFLHLPQHFVKGTSTSPNVTAAILLSGAGGGVTGPSGIYLSLADKLASLDMGIPTLRLDYRFPARNAYCVQDVLAAMRFLEEMYNLKRFILVGWSFGGAPVFTVAGNSQKVIACATIASQTEETEGIRKLAPRPVLLLHGSLDQTLSPSCLEKLFAEYGPKGDRRVKVFEGDDHALTRHAEEAEQILFEFIIERTCISVDEWRKKVIMGMKLVEDAERMNLMKQGGDLRMPESVY